MELLITTKNIYGNPLMYPANLTAKLFAELLGKKTFNVDDLININKLGYKIIYDNNLEIYK